MVINLSQISKFCKYISLRRRLSDQRTMPAQPTIFSQHLAELQCLLSVQHDLLAAGVSAPHLEDLIHEKSKALYNLRVKIRVSCPSRTSPL